MTAPLLFSTPVLMTVHVGSLLSLSSYTFGSQVDNIILVTDLYIGCDLQWAIKNLKEINNKALVVQLFMLEW